MKELLNRLSSYNFFNFLLPGVVFALVATRFTGYDLIYDDVVVGFFAYYFIGMIISRIGSLVVEPALIKFKLIEYSEYEKYVEASLKDEKIDLLLEVNNTYRTVISLLLCLVVFKFFDLILTGRPFLTDIVLVIFGIGILLLFLLSYKKQTRYINKRVKTHICQQDKKD